MKHAWRQFLSPVPGSVRVLLAILVVCYLAAVLGLQTRTFNLYAWLALSSPEFWQGRVWQAATYWLLPAGLPDFVLNGFMAAWLAALLARGWSRWELWNYWMICGLGTALAQVLLLPRAPCLMVGTFGIVLGLLAAFAREYGREQWDMFGVWRMSGRTVAIVMAAVSLGLSIPCAGLVGALVMLCGGITGWCWLVLRSKVKLAHRSEVVPNERINRLEL